MAHNEVIDLTVDPRGLLPPVVVQGWLPNEEQSILFLFQFDRYPPRPSHYIHPSNFQSVLHQEAVFPFEFDLQSLLSIAPPVLPSIPQAYEVAMKRSPHPILSVTLQPHHGNPVTLPHWIFTYWTEIQRALDTRRRWKVALEWIKKNTALPAAAELRSQLLLALSSFSWSRGASYTADIVPLFSSTSKEAYLNTFHLDHMILWMRDQCQEKDRPNVTRHIFTSVDQFNTMMSFYSRVSMKKEGAFWNTLMGIENKVIQGEVDSVCGIINLREDHWVSVVINFQQCKILYGDSFYQPMPTRQREACKRWVKHLIKRSTHLVGEVTVGALEIGVQKDGISCGLFALNSIAHHYLGHPLLPTDSVALNYCRMEIGLNILSTMTVCLLAVILQNSDLLFVIDCRWDHLDPT